MTGKRKYVEKVLGQKVDALQVLSNGMAMRACTVKYGVSLGNWNKNNDKIIASISQNQAPTQKRSSWVIGDGKLVDERVYEWFASARSRNIPVSGRILQEKALKVAEGIGMNDFKASNGWLEAFRKRHNIRFRMLSGESTGMDQQ